jgi:prevent-host-death family protein
VATYNMHQAKTQLSKLIECVQEGETVTIARAGKPVALLGPLHTGKAPRRRGFLKGQIQLGPEFDEALPADVLDAFEGKS